MYDNQLSVKINKVSRIISIQMIIIIGFHSTQIIKLYIYLWGLRICQTWKLRRKKNNFELYLHGRPFVF